MAVPIIVIEELDVKLAHSLTSNSSSLGILATSILAENLAISDYSGLLSSPFIVTKLSSQHSCCARPYTHTNSATDHTLNGITNFPA